jgi:hypothetical protein
MSTINPPSQARIQIRPEAASPIADVALQPYSTNLRHRICFRHPHYRAPTNVLLDLVALDGPDGGLEYGFAHTACSVIAGNRWDGFFTQGVDGSPLQLAHGDIMPKGEYYFQIGGSTLEVPYPIVPTFREWPFPHNNLPPSWADIIQPPLPTSGRSYTPSNFSTAIIAQNITCRMSNFEEGTEAAHLCPRSELEWSRYNRMSIYNTSPGLPPDRILDDTANALLLREDLHTQFDANKFVFVPKKGADIAETTSIVTHLLMPIQELGLLHHNVQLKPILNVHPAFLLARFALAIFRFSEQFLAEGVDRNILGVDGVPKMVLGNDCKKLTARTRSQNPTKKSKRSLPNDDNGGLMDTEIGQRNHKRQRHDQSFRSSGIETVGGPPVGTDVVTASEEKPQTPQTQLSRTGALRKEWLKSERQRSDPENTWTQERAWVESVWDGKTMGPQEAKRFYEFYGMES